MCFRIRARAPWILSLTGLVMCPVLAHPDASPEPRAPERVHVAGTAASSVATPAVRRVSGPWWGVVSAAIEADEYEASFNSRGLQAPNREWNLRTYFQDGGVEIVPRAAGSGPARACVWRTTAWGREDLMEKVADRATRPVPAGTRVSYEHAGLSEWYENTKDGLKQGFRIQDRPSGRGPVVIEGEIGEVLRQGTSRRGAVADSHGPSEGASLGFTDLHARDATGSDLPVAVEKTGDRMAIRIEDGGASYPLTVARSVTISDWSMEGDQDSAQFGWSVASAGDVNGDGYSDVVIGARYFDNGDPDEGRAYLYLGSPAGLATNASWTAEGEQEGAQFGVSVGTAGDVNGDGYADVIIGAYFYDGGETDEGRAFLYNGSTNGLGSNVSWTAEGDQASSRFGFSVGAAGDVNKDGYADVIVGAFAYDNGETNEGRAYVYHGSAGGLSTSAAWVKEGNQVAANFGVSVGTAGDVNKDGYADVIIGAYLYDNGQIDEGRAYVYRGSSGGLGANPIWTAEGDQDTAYYGSSVGTAGDVNGDGYSDVIVGAYYYDNGEPFEGKAFVYHGSSNGPATSASWSAESNYGYSGFGRSVGTAGDVNGDIYSDVIIGAPWYQDETRLGGLAFVYNGSASGLAGTESWTAECGQLDAWFGISAATAGDVNGDGYADIVVGAPLYDSGDLEEGAAFVYQGSPLGVASVVGWVGMGDGTSWEDADNWSPARVPGPTDEARIAMGNPTVRVTQRAEVLKLSVEGASTVSVDSDTLHVLWFCTNEGAVHVAEGAALDLAEEGELWNLPGAEVRLAGGDLVGAGVLVNGGDVRKQGISATSRIEIAFENREDDPGDGALYVEEGLLAIEGILTSQGSLRVNPSAVLRLDPGDGPFRGTDLLINSGLVVVETGAEIALQTPTTVFLNLGSGTVELQGGDITGSGTLQNYGLVVKTDPTSPSRARSRIVADFENVTGDPGDGALNVNVGILSIEGDFQNTGSIRVNAAATMVLDPGDGPLRPGSSRVDGAMTNAASGVCQVFGDFTVEAGATVANAGIVEVPQDGLITNLGDFELQTNGVLAGAGTFDNSSGSFTGGGVIRPGDSTGVLTFLGDLVQTATGEIDIEIGGTTPGTGYDRLAVSGAASLNGALYTTLIRGFAPAEGDSFTVVTIGGGSYARTDFECLSGLTAPGGLFLDPVQEATAFSLVARDSTVANESPVGNADTDSTNAVTPITLSVLSNDTDADANVLRVALVSTEGTSGGVNILPGDSVILYSPVRAFSGRDHFVYTVTDCYGGSDTALVTIGVARAPRAWRVPADAPTIDSALALTWPEDSVVVAPGTYHEHDIVMRPGVLLRSETMDPSVTVIDADSVAECLSCVSCDSSTVVMGITFAGANGSAVICTDADVIFDRCTFSGNVASASGGGISLGSGRPVIRRCLFEGNRAAYGGAMVISGLGADAIIESTLIANNWAGTAGGAVYALQGAHPIIRSCTISGNASPGGSAGIHIDGTVPTTVEVENSIIVSNTGAASSPVATCTFGGSIALSCSDVYGNSGGNYGGCLAGQEVENGNFSAEPRFCQTGSPHDWYALMSGSPCAPVSHPACGLVGARPEGCGAVTGVVEAPRLPGPPRLQANRPNPFNPATTIRVSLPRAEPVTLTVYDVSGRRVRVLADGLMGPGEREVTWNGKDDAGRDAASGIYFVALTGLEFAETRKLVLLR